MNQTVRYAPRINPETMIAAACAARAASVDPAEIFTRTRGSNGAARARCIAMHLIYTRNHSTSETALQFGRAPGAVWSASVRIVERCDTPAFGRGMAVIHKVYDELRRRHQRGDELACVSLPIGGQRS